MDLFKILNGNNYICFNREIAREIGIQAALMLSELIDRHTYYEKMGKLEDGWFFLTVEDAEERIILSKDSQQTAIRKLSDIGFIECKLKGLPAKRHFKINIELVTDWIIPSNKMETPPRQLEVEKPSNSEEENPPTSPYIRTKEEPKHDMRSFRQLEKKATQETMPKAVDRGSTQEKVDFLKQIVFPDESVISQRNIETWCRLYTLWRMKKTASILRSMLESGKEITNGEGLFYSILKQDSSESTRQIEENREKIYAFLESIPDCGFFIDHDFVVNYQSKKEFSLSMTPENIINEIKRLSNV